MHIDASTPVVVLGVHDHNGLAQIRSLGRLGVEVAITHAPGRPPPAARSRYVTRRFGWDVRGEPHERTARHLLDVVGPALGRRAVLLPSEDASAIVVAEHGEALAEWFLVPEQPASLSRRLVDKLGLHEVCEQTGTPSPRTVAPASQADVDRFLSTAEFPVVVKARDAWRVRTRTDRVTFLAHDAAEVAEALPLLTFEGDFNAVLQEYVPGEVDTVWTYHAYTDRRGETIFASVGNKLRDYPVDTGLATFGISCENAEVVAAGTGLLQQLGYRGVVDLDFRFDARDGRHKLLDFNPRPGANFRLTADSEGMDVVRAAYLDLTGQDVPVGDQCSGRKWVVEHWDLAAARKHMRLGRLTMADYVRSLRGVSETAWWAADDLAPFAAMTAQFAGIGVRQVTGGGRSRRTSDRRDRESRG